MGPGVPLTTVGLWEGGGGVTARSSQFPGEETQDAWLSALGTERNKSNLPNNKRLTNIPKYFY